MRIAVISDIHGNLEALTSVLEDIASQAVDSIFSLGDNIGYGADSENVIQVLMANDIPTVIGNHEFAILNDKSLNWYNEDVKKAIKIAIKSLSEGSLQYLKKAAFSVSASGCLFVHGFPPDSCRLYLHQVDDDRLRYAFTEMKDNVCFVGHTHRLNVMSYDTNEIFLHRINQTRLKLHKHNKYIINAGSVGQPRDGSLQAKYVIWDSRSYQLDIRAVNYDTATAAQKIIAAGIPARFADRIDSDD